MRRNLCWLWAIHSSGLPMRKKTQWLPYYYAALCQVNLGYMTGGASPSPAVTDPYADKAEELLQKAETLVGAPNAEIFIVKK
ncbi:MAG: hypothetical protein NVV59_16025 [Chitinophagaceae bacterium]|nr:hypothetical protein [Chitinophagaceae bacterium]